MNKSQCLESNNEKIEKKKNSRNLGSGVRVSETVIPLNNGVQNFNLVGGFHAQVAQV